MPHHTPTSQEVILVLVLASWLNIVLYTLEIVLCLRYFERPARPLIHKIGVGLLVLADTVCTGAVLFDVCLTIGVGGIGTGGRNNFMVALDALVLQIIPTYVSAAISQLFLTNLFVVLVGSKLLGLPLVLLILVHVTFSWGSAIASIVTLNLGGIVLTTTSIGAISCSVTDLIIASCLAWKFWTMTGPSSDLSSKSRLRLVLILIVSSGAICATITTAMMILILKQSLAYDFLFACHGRVYALTLLGNFLLGAPSRRAQTTFKLSHIKTIGSQSMAIRFTEHTTTSIRNSYLLRDSNTVQVNSDATHDSRLFERYDWIQFDEIEPSPDPWKLAHRDSGSA
ncbi:hypothetical protein K438DRAFT_1988246 [Mycena galopus ATCC 62051]|nr:hypothetical protein K438DRAFT_1988246 [Mycena galopus ATCC 62051]